jgi:hypothetical protein
MLFCSVLSSSERNPDYARCVLLIRDPGDAMIADFKRRKAGKVGTPSWDEFKSIGESACSAPASEALCTPDSRSSHGDEHRRASHRMTAADARALLAPLANLSSHSVTTAQSELVSALTLPLLVGNRNHRPE